MNKNDAYALSRFVTNTNVMEMLEIDSQTIQRMADDLIKAAAHRLATTIAPLADDFSIKYPKHPVELPVCNDFEWSAKTDFWVKTELFSILQGHGIKAVVVTMPPSAKQGQQA